MAAARKIFILQWKNLVYELLMIHRNHPKEYQMVSISSLRQNKLVVCYTVSYNLQVTVHGAKQDNHTNLYLPCQEKIILCSENIKQIRSVESSKVWVTVTFDSFLWSSEIKLVGCCENHTSARIYQTVLKDIEIKST